MDTQAIREMIDRYVVEAKKIMYDKENHDSTYGACMVLFLCGTIIELLNEIDNLESCIQDIMWEKEQ